MLSRRFKKYITVEQRNRFMNAFEQKFTIKEYKLFLRKFRGSLLSKGRSSLSYKLYDQIRVYFKKVLKGKRLDNDAVFKAAISNLIPIIGTANVRRGRRIETVPLLLKLRKRIVLINKWLISSQKNKSNVRGIKIKDVSRLIFDSIKDKGNVYDQKMEYLKKAYSARHILLKMGGKRVNRRAFWRAQNQLLEKLKLKHELIINKKKEETLIESIPNLFKLIIFLKYKRKYKRVRRMTNKLRAHLLVSWYDPKLHLQKRWLTAWHWVNYFTWVSKKYKINTKKLDSLKPKYNLVCKDIEKRIK